MLDVADVLPIVFDVDVASFLPLDDVHHVRKVHVDVAMCFAPDCIMCERKLMSECALELRGAEIDVWSKT